MSILVLVLLNLSFTSWYHLNRVQQLPHSIAHAAVRITLVTQIVDQCVAVVMNPLKKQLHVSNIVAFIDELHAVHQSLLFDLDNFDSSAGRFANQDELHFSNDFVTVNGSLGLHVLLEQFINSVEKFLTLVYMESLTLDSPVVSSLIEQRPRISEAMVDSIDFYHDETFSAIQTGLIAVRLMFTLSVVTLLIVYFLVFLRMIKSLEAEQHSTALLLEMFPEHCLQNNMAIKSFCQIL
ncbi:hypothetical protein GEMRC1_008600 [Eukaryota sp. GEM-RC1]